MRLRGLAVGDVPVRALRVTYVGELGWELYCPMEYGAALWRTLWEAGRPLGLIAGGYGYAVARSIAYGYLPTRCAQVRQRGEVEVFGEWVGAEVAAEPLYDPEGARIRS